MHKHTPGPWHVAPSSEFSSGVNVCAGRMYVCLVSGSTPDEMAQADARLISAAPDLLAALKLALQQMESDWEAIEDIRGDLRKIAQAPDAEIPAIIAARAAIAKATGNPVP